ncbi:type IV conjugative transfer system coupling protein TraD [Pseudescherichia vulneris]|uniref:type IV conjugative transfer system coupling protein TraD n=1 Tax=Pseudescherichia vulneris TaxID=566 RepID=UPI001EDE89A5|nr:type IV conjugative transfer system coupling protein TraD [Pseudescherichia vulneris]
MSFAGKNLTQGGQMTAYRWRMFIQVNNWISFWVFIMFSLMTSIIFFWRVPQEMLDNGMLYWFARINHSFIDLMPAGAGKFYDVHYYYAPTNTALTLKMTLAQIVTDPYMNVMGDRLAGQLQMASAASGVFSIGMFIAVSWYVARVGKKESEDKFISGMTLTEKPSEVNALLRKRGELSDLRVGDLHMVKRAEVMNFLIHGTIGVGKSTLIRWLLNYIRKRGDRAIIYDSGCTFTETHYDPSTDFILNAHDTRCANWQLWGECIDAVDYDNMAASLIPVEGDSDPFWVSSSRTIFADLAIRMSADKDRSIEKFLTTLLSLSMKSLREYLANTPSANLVEEKIEKTAISIRSVVTNYAKALRYLQGLDDGEKPPFTIREWMTNEQYDNSWLFISTQARHRKSVRPLISLWVSLATLMLQSMGENSERRVWFIYDEIPSLQRIPEFSETLAEGRKFGGCFVLGVQNMAQLVHVYGRELSKSIFDLLNTRMYGRSPSAEMAKIVEEELGNQRRREIRESNSYGNDSVRDGVTLGKDKVKDPIVDYERVMSLPNLTFFVRLPGEYPVVKLALKYQATRKYHTGLIERNIRDVLSPELEKVIQENERNASLAGLAFPTGEILLDGEAAAPNKMSPESSLTAAATKPSYTPKTNRQELKVDDPIKEPPTQANPVQSSPPHSVVTPAPRSAEKNVKSNVTSLHAVTPVSAGNKPVRQEPGLQQQLPAKTPADVSAALQSLRSRNASATTEKTSAVSTNSALAMLRQARQRPADTGSEETANAGDGGDSMELDVKVTELADGVLELTTASAKGRQDEAPDPGRVTRSLAEEEVNILHHRHPDDPGYSEHDHYYDDGEREL